MVYGVFDTTLEDDVVIAEDFNPGRSIGNGNDVALNIDTRFETGIPANPRVTTKSMLGDVDFEAG